MSTSSEGKTPALDSLPENHNNRDYNLPDAPLQNHGAPSENGAKPTSTRRVSPKKIEANRRNARKSTGPRTERGKANVRSNALKLGFFSTVIVMSSRFIEEDPKEFEALLWQLQEHYQPVGIAEELQVDTIAVCIWRERRAQRCEMGEIWHAQVVNDHEAYTQDNRHPAQKLIYEGLKKTESELLSKGELSNEARTFLSFQPGFEMSDLEPDSEDDDHWADQLPQRIRERIKLIEELAQQSWTYEELRIRERYALPPTDQIDRILRFQAMNDRRLYRALAELDRLQRQRNGEFVPAPVSVSVG